MPDNRIVQGGELEIGSDSLEDVIVDKPVSGSGSKPDSKFVNGIKNVDMSYLDGRLINYLGNIGVNPNVSHAHLRIINLLSTERIEIVKSIGNLFFKIDGLHYAHIKDNKIVMGNLILNPEIPYTALKKAIAVSVGDEHVDYFMEEFSDRLEITDETKVIDASKPELQPYLPGITQVQQMNGQYSLMADVYLLLLTLDPEDREPLTFFFNAARESKVFPFDRKFETNFSTNDDYVEGTDYCLTRADINHITQNPHIIPFHEIVRIGSENKIKGIAEYTDRLKNFRDTLKNIPGP